MKLKEKILFITDIHQNVEAVKKIDFSKYDMVLCGGDILAPNSSALDIAFSIINLLPENTVYVPGNCDKNSTIIKQISDKMIYLHKNTVKIKGYNILGIGYSRSLEEDIKIYRKFFLEDKNRIYEFIKENNQMFILKSCGIEIDKNNEIKILPEENGKTFLKDFASQFVSFKEEEIKKFFNENDLKNTDILITHSPPYGLLDKLNGLPNIGSTAIKEGMEKIRPKLVLCGHFHELTGDINNNGMTVFNPGAIKDNKYGEIEIFNDKIDLFYKTI